MNILTIEQIEEYRLLSPLFHSLLKEVKELSKKKNDEIINEFKANTINKILIRIKDLLKEEPTFEFIESIDVNRLPSNSDVVLIMVQFETALEKFHYKYTQYDTRTRSRIWSQ